MVDEARSPPRPGVEATGPSVPPGPGTNPARDLGGTVARFFHDHPVLALAVLTPGIPEYLSTSSPVLNLVANPVFFLLQLGINLGQYTAGALLIREAVVRWGRGWPTVAALGVAYAVIEEGLGDSTLENATH